MLIRKATTDDYDAIWKIFEAVIQTGDTYPFSPDTTKESLTKHWFADYMNSYVMDQNGQIIATYMIKPNQIDLGSLLLIVLIWFILMHEVKVRES